MQGTIVHVEVWATDDIPADLPPMVEFKAKADAIIKERYGIEVDHIDNMTAGHVARMIKQEFDKPYKGIEALCKWLMGEE